MLPYKSSSHSAKCVRCASLRSGGRRLAVRIAMEHPIGAMPRTPFPASRDFAPVGSMSLDSRVAGLPYESSSFATSRGNEKIGGTEYCVTYDTDSQSRNAPCVPFRGRGPQSGEGVDGGNPDYDTRCGRDRRRRHYKTHRPKGRYHNPRPEGPSNLRTLRPSGRSILRTFPCTTLFHNPSTQPAADRQPQPSGRSPVNPHTEGVSQSPPRSSPSLFTLWYNISDYMPASVSLAESRAVK